MRRILTAGMVGAMRRWRVAVLLWLVTLLFGLTFSGAVAKWFELALNASVASRTLAWHFDFNLLADLFTYHRESLGMVWVAGALVAVVYLLLAVWMNAGTVGAVQDPDVSFTLRQFWWRGMILYPTFVRLWALAGVAEVAVAAATWFGVRATSRWLTESPNELSIYFAWAVCLGLGAATLLVLVTVHDQARIYAVRKRVGAWRALQWAGWFVVRGDHRSLLVLPALLVIGGAPWLVYQIVAHVIPIMSAELAVLSFVWGQGLMLIRAVLRVASFAAQTELQAEMPD